jgi:hypothetical protein
MALSVRLVEALAYARFHRSPLLLQPAPSPRKMQTPVQVWKPVAEMALSLPQRATAQGDAKWYHTLSGPASLDACGNPRSHRAGLLTFEHQGLSGI